MFTPLMNKKTDERGALMIEAIALLGLMTMMSPMVVRQTADRTVEMEDVAIAGQMKELKDALSNWIEANYASIKAACSAGGTIAVAGGASCANSADSHFAVPVAGLAPYLPATYLETVSSGNNSTTFRLRGNKLADGFDVGVRAQCTEATNTSTGATCGSMGMDGVYTGLSSTCTCSRYKMTGVVLSNGAAEIDDRRAARIATMIGADGGFVRTSNMVNNVLSGNGRTTIVGSQGIWEGDATNYIVGYNSSAGGRVAATTIYSSGFSGDYLYRKQVDGLPGANSMFTNLDMGGAIECNGTQCHKINNAGGLEVVGGKILIRSQNTANGDDQEEGNSGDAGYARVLLGTDSSHINMTNRLSLGVSGTTSSSLNMTNFTTDLNAPNIGITAANQASLSGREAFITANSWIDIVSNQDVNLAAVRTMDIYSQNTMDIYSQNTMYLTAINQMQLVSNNRAYINALNRLFVNAPTQYINATNYIWLNVTNGSNSLRQSLYPYAYFLNIRNSTANTETGVQIGTTYLKTAIHNGTRAYQTQTEFSVKAVSSDNPRIIDNTLASFGLYNMRNTDATFQINVMNNTNFARRMIYNQEGLTLFAHTNGFQNSSRGQEIIFRNNAGERAKIGVEDDGRGTRVYVMRDLGGVGSNPVGLYGDSGRVSGTFFQPESLAVNNNRYANSIVGRARIQIDEDTGRTTAGKTTTNADYYNTAYVDINTGNLGGPYSPYRAHLINDRDKYKNFRVDPAFVSVMNDIKITSRGGARLSEALPNYILKGIYQLSNDYAYGGWPCGESLNTASEKWVSSCSYSMPYMTFNQLGMVNGGWEFNCSRVDSTHPHPVEAAGDGTCTCSSGTCDGSSGTEGTGKYVTFKFGASGAKYRECPDGAFCWAHPFMGIVPAPGRSVSYPAVNSSGASVTETQSAQDEGVCPDGYQAVMTLTPNAFDVARVLYSRHDEGNPISYNPGWQDFSDNSNNYAVHGIRIMQPSQRMIVMQQPETNAAGQVLGWKIAMGFASYYNDAAGTFVWNVGGVSTGSWTALAHTYCYFNPQRFDMPNMRFIGLKDNGEPDAAGNNDVILTPMDNPILDDSTYRKWMN